MRFPNFIFLLLILFTGNFSNAQSHILKIDSIGQGIATDRFWLFQNGDDASFSKITFDDQHWDTISPQLSTQDELKRFTGICWFRLHVRFDSSLKNLPLAIRIFQTGASEIYFDGEKIGGFGIVSNNEKTEERKDPLGVPVPFNYNSSGNHVFAIRYSNHDIENKDVPSTHSGGKMAGFEMNVIPSAKTFSSLLFSQSLIIAICFSLGCFYLVLGLVHLLLWFFYKQNRSNLYYFLFVINLCIFPFFTGIGYFVSDFKFSTAMRVIDLFSVTLVFVSLLNLVYHLFYEKFPKRFKWYFIAGIICTFLVQFDVPNTAQFLFAFCFSATIDTIFTVSIAVRRRKRGSKIIATGILLFTGFTFLVLLSGMFSHSFSINIDSSWSYVIFIFVFLSMISIPVSMSVFLAKDFSETNRSLVQKLEEIKILSAKTIEQEKEKQKILESQKENLEREVTERTAEIVQQKNIIEEKNKDITASIQYAKRIQQSLLPTEKYIARNMKRLRK